MIKSFRVESADSSRLISKVVHALSPELLLRLIVSELAVRTSIVASSRDFPLIQQSLDKVVSATCGAAGGLRGERTLFVNPRRPTRHQVIAEARSLDRALLVALLHHGSSQVSFLLEPLQDLLLAMLIKLGAAEGARMQAAPVRRLADVVVRQVSS